jgi:hypothetical protein
MWVASDVEMIFSVDQSIQLVRGGEFGRGGPIFWPPRSPELTPMDFYVGYVRNIAYGEKIRDLRHLRDRIITAIGTVTPDMIQRTWHEIELNL